MKLRYIAALALALTAATGAIAQTSQRITAGKSNEYGLIYRLPVTEVEVVLEAKKTVQTPGEFYRYAKKYLNLDPILEPSVNWELTKAEIYPRAIPDDAEEYLAQFKSGANVFITLTAESIPVSINDAAWQPAAPEKTALQAVAAQPTILEKPVARQAVTEEMLKSQSSAKRAELAAAKIYEIRQQRSDIISGQAENMPTDGAAMQLALETLAEQEAALTAMFTGTVSTSTDVKTYTYYPEGEKDKDNVVIARLSALDGLVAADDLSGDPVYLQVAVTSRGELPKNEKNEEKTFPKGGVAYCIPGQAQVSVDFEGKSLAERKLSMGQLGVVFGLDPKLFLDKKAPEFVRFDPLTGAIIELGPVSERAAE